MWIKLFRKKVLHSKVFLKILWYIVLRTYSKATNYNENSYGVGSTLNTNQKEFHLWNTKKKKRSEILREMFWVLLTISEYKFPCILSMPWSPTESHGLQDYWNSTLQNATTLNAWSHRGQSAKRDSLSPVTALCLPEMHSSPPNSIHVSGSWEDHLWKEP